MRRNRDSSPSGSKRVRSADIGLECEHQASSGPPGAWPGQEKQVGDFGGSSQATVEAFPTLKSVIAAPLTLSGALLMLGVTAKLAFLADNLLRPAHGGLYRSPAR